LLGFVGFRGRTEAGSSPERMEAIERVCGADVLLEWSRGAPLNTDDFPVIEFSAAASHQNRLPHVHGVMEAVAQLRAAEQRSGTKRVEATQAQ
jgi:hypothetical protein